MPLKWICTISFFEWFSYEVSQGRRPDNWAGPLPCSGGQTPATTVVRQPSKHCRGSDWMAQQGGGNSQGLGPWRQRRKRPEQAPQGVGQERNRMEQREAPRAPHPSNALTDAVERKSAAQKTSHTIHGLIMSCNKFLFTYWSPANSFLSTVT